MRFYFLSDTPCALKLGGIYAGITHNAEKYMNIDVSDGILCEFIPLNPEFLPISFIIDERYFPPPNVKCYLLRDAILIFAENFLRADCSFKLIAQKTFEREVVSVFVQGKVFVSLEYGGEIFTEELNGSFLSAEIEKRGEYYIITSPTFISVLDKSLKKLLFTEFTSCDMKEILTLTVSFCDCLNCSAVIEYGFENGFCELKKTLKSAPPSNVPVIYAVLDGLLTGYDVSEFISEGLKDKLSTLKSFLGNYEKVLFITKEVAGLSYKVKDNIYRVDYYEAEYENGKICNFKEKSVEE